jgi:hypothetical protein
MFRSPTYSSSAPVQFTYLFFCEFHHTLSMSEALLVWQYLHIQWRSLYAADVSPYHIIRILILSREEEI